MRGVFLYVKPTEVSVSKYLAARQACKKRNLPGQGKEKKAKYRRPILPEQQCLIYLVSEQHHLHQNYSLHRTLLLVTPRIADQDPIPSLRILEDYVSSTIMDGPHGSMHQGKVQDNIHMHAKHSERYKCCIPPK